MGFVFGSSKKGQEVRGTIDGMLTELTSSDAIKALDGKKNELSEIARDTFSKIKGDEAVKPQKTKAEKSGQESFEPEESNQDVVDVTGSTKELDADKAQELADKLGAKPSTPDDENLAAFSHHDDDLKSA